MKFRVLLFLLFMSSCSSFNNKRSNVFSKDSDFLKNGNKIEVVEEPPIIKEKIKEKEVKVVQEPSKPKKKSVVRVKKNKAKIKRVQKKEIIKKPVVKKDTEKKNLIKEEKELPFKVGEKVVLSAKYFGMEAGKISIGVAPLKRINGKKVQHFYVEGKTTSLFSMLYSVKDKIDSLWDPITKKPLSLAFDVKETKQKFKIRVYFDWLKRTADYFEEGWMKRKGNYKDKQIWKLPKSAQDIVSSMFYVRTLPLEVGKFYKFKVFENSKIIDTTLYVDRKEVLKTRVGKINALVLKPSFMTKGKFKKVGDINIWLSDDEYRQIIRIETKIKIGTVVASLYSLKRP